MSIRYSTTLIHWKSITHMYLPPTIVESCTQLQLTRWDDKKLTRIKIQLSSKAVFSKISTLLSKNCGAVRVPSTAATHGRCLNQPVFARKHSPKQKHDSGVCWCAVDLAQPHVAVTGCGCCRYVMHWAQSLCAIRVLQFGKNTQRYHRNKPYSCVYLLVRSRV